MTTTDKKTGGRVMSRRSAIAAAGIATVATTGTARAQASGETSKMAAEDLYFIQRGTGAKARSIADRLRDEISPLDFGAICDGHADDRDAIQAAANLAMQSGRPLILRPRAGGHWRIGGTLDFSIRPGPDAANFIMPPVIDGCNSLIKPVEGVRLDVMIRCRNTANARFQNLRIDGDGRAGLLLDTSWDLPGPPPARNVAYSQLELRGAAGPVSWKAHRENDSPITSCIIAGPGGYPHIGLDLIASGGHVRLISPEIFDAVVRVSCQSLTLHDGVISGVQVVGADDNCIVFSGNGYSYPSAGGINVEIAEGARITAFRASGRFENAHPGGAIVGGRGKLCGGMDFDGAIFLQPNTRNTVRLVAPDVGSVAGGYSQAIRVRGGAIAGIDPSGSIDVAVTLDGTFIDGVLAARRRLGAHNRIIEDGEQLSYVQHTAAYGAAATLRSVVVRGALPGRPTRFTLSEFPFAGILSIRSTAGNGPAGVFAYARGGGDQFGVVRDIVTSPASAGLTLRMTEGTSPSFELVHTLAGLQSDFIIALCGTS